MTYLFIQGKKAQFRLHNQVTMRPCEQCYENYK